MASAATILADWASMDPEKEKLYATTPNLLVRWLNEAQLRFCDKSEILEETWNPTITSSGSIALPANFLREYIYDVWWTSDRPMRKGLYSILSKSTVTYYNPMYAIYGNTFYVFPVSAGTPTIRYIKKPTLITFGNATPVADPVRSVRAGEEAVAVGDNIILFKIDDVQTPMIGTYVLWLEMYDSGGNIIDVTPTPIKTVDGFAIAVEQAGTVKYTATPTT
jgi:hypothetical protein